MSLPHMVDRMDGKMQWPRPNQTWCFVCDRRILP